MKMIFVTVLLAMSSLASAQTISYNDALALCQAGNHPNYSVYLISNGGCASAQLGLAAVLPQPAGIVGSGWQCCRPNLNSASNTTTSSGSVTQGQTSGSTTGSSTEITSEQAMKLCRESYPNAFMMINPPGCTDGLVPVTPQPAQLHNSRFACCYKRTGGSSVSTIDDATKICRATDPNSFGQTNPPGCPTGTIQISPSPLTNPKFVCCKKSDGGSTNGEFTQDMATKLCQRENPAWTAFANPPGCPQGMAPTASQPANVKKNRFVCCEKRTTDGPAGDGSSGDSSRLCEKMNPTWFTVNNPPGCPRGTSRTSPQPDEVIKLKKMCCQKREHPGLGGGLVNPVRPVKPRGR